MRSLLLVCVLCLPMFAHASRPGDPPVTGLLFETVAVGGVEYRSAVYRPRGWTPDGSHPALLFLHGWGECGTDGSLHLTVGLPPAILRAPERWPFVVLIPQKPTHNSEWEHHEEALLAMLDRLPEHHGVDPERIAITGLSQGGHGTIQLAARHPERFRAAVPVCGYVLPRFHDGGVRDVPEMPGADDPRVRALAEPVSAMPVWLVHGLEDNVVEPEESRLFHEALARAGRNATLTLLKDADHNAWDPAYNDPALAAWLIEQTR